MSIKNVFIIMPYGEQIVGYGKEPRTYSKEYFDDLYTILVQAVREYSNNIHVDRMEQPWGNLVSAIIRRLASADLVIAVLAGRNPNVFYELGIRHTLRLNTIMLVENWDEYPFDLYSYFSQKYSIAHEKDRNELKAFIITRITELEKQSLPDSPVIETLQLSEFEQFKVVNAWETRRAALILEGLVREVIGMFNRFSDCMNDVKEINSGKRSYIRKIDVEFDVLDGFTKNRPVPGLPTQVYSDAEKIHSSWKRYGRIWNNLAKKPRNKEDVIELQNVIAITDRDTCAFLFDLMNTWEYIMEHSVSFGLPWDSSLGKAESLISKVSVLQSLRTKLILKMSELLKKYELFDRSYLGVPESMIKLVTSESTYTEPLKTIIQKNKIPETPLSKVIKGTDSKKKRSLNKKK